MVAPIVAAIWVSAMYFPRPRRDPTSVTMMFHLDGDAAAAKICLVYVSSQLSALIKLQSSMLKNKKIAYTVLAAISILIDDDPPHNPLPSTNRTRSPRIKHR